MGSLPPKNDNLSAASPYTEQARFERQGIASHATGCVLARGSLHRQGITSQGKLSARPLQLSCESQVALLENYKRRNASWKPQRGRLEQEGGLFSLCLDKALGKVALLTLIPKATYHRAQSIRNLCSVRICLCFVFSSNCTCFLFRAGGGGRFLGTAPSMRWTRLTARTFEHGHRPVCGGGLFEVAVDPEEHVFGAAFLVDSYL